jgi:hypothetical protein
MAPATFLTSLGLIEAAMVRTNAIVSSMTGAGISATSRTDGSPKALNRIARMTCSFPMFDPTAYYAPRRFNRGCAGHDWRQSNNG